MKTTKLIAALGAALLVSACATPQKDIASLDAKIADYSQGDFGQFLYHQAMAEENLAHVRKVRQWWQNDYYWNIETETCAENAAAKALEHRKQAEEALIRWHDRCERHQDMCQRLDNLEFIHSGKRMPVAYFDTGSAVPKSLEQAHIDALLGLAKDYPNLTLDLVGYTDSVGSKASNKHLASHRTQAVNSVLNKSGLPSSVHVHQINEGEAPGPDNTANAGNRRVDVRVHGHGYAGHDGPHHKRKHRYRR